MPPTHCDYVTKAMPFRLYLFNPIRLKLPNLYIYKNNFTEYHHLNQTHLKQIQNLTSIPPPN
jgi:hypothetical protein